MGLKRPKHAMAIPASARMQFANTKMDHASASAVSRAHTRRVAAQRADLANPLDPISSERSSCQKWHSLWL